MLKTSTKTTFSPGQGIMALDKCIIHNYIYMRPHFKLSFNKPILSHSPLSYTQAITPMARMKYRSYDSKSQNVSSSSQSSGCHDSNLSQKYNSLPPETYTSFKRSVKKAHRELKPIDKINACAVQAKVLKEKRIALDQISISSVRHLKKREVQTLQPKKLLEIIHLRKIRESALLIWRFWKMHKIAKSYSSIQGKLNASTLKIQSAWKKHYFRSLAAKLKSQLFNNMAIIITRVAKAYQLIKHFRNATIDNTLKHNIMALEQMGLPHKQCASQVMLKFVKAYMLSKDIKECRNMCDAGEKKDRRKSEGICQMRRISKVDALKRGSLFNNIKFNNECYSEVIRLKM
jgi:hypothetical protein